jgi:RNA polymerase sigma factor (sigma-70 family)
MTPEEFIKKHPFPKNGAEINDRLVKAIQDPKLEGQKEANLKKLLENNARLIYLIYHQYNYNQELGSIMSFVYEGLRKASAHFDPNVGMPFYHYAVQTIRGLLQNHYNYNNDLIHIPVMKRKTVKYEYADVTDYSEYQGLASVDLNDVEEPISELDMLITEYENQENITEQSKSDLEIIKLYRNHTLKDISEKTGINTVKLRKIIDKTIVKLQKFYAKLNKD